MSMEINSIRSNYAENYTSTLSDEKKIKDESSVKTEATNQTNQTHLSSKAQKLLDKLSQTYSDMDFLVADFDKGDDAKEVLSRGTKEFSVVFSSAELEKMASDEKYLEEKMQGVAGAIRMSEQINEQFGFESAFGKTANGSNISKIAISFHDDGTTTFFAELEKSSAEQKERIEKARDEKLAEKKEDEKKAEKETQSNRWNRIGVKRTFVQANSIEELMEKANSIDWSKVNTEKKFTGSRFDFTI